jgi:hypothetical protein
LVTTIKCQGCLLLAEGAAKPAARIVSICFAEIGSEVNFRMLLRPKIAVWSSMNPYYGIDLLNMQPYTTFF